MLRHGRRTALVDAAGAHAFADLDAAAGRAAGALLAGARDLAEQRVAFLLPPDHRYVIAQQAIWRAGGIAVPLGFEHPPPEIERAVADSDAAILIGTPESAARLRPIAQARGARLLTTEDLARGAASDEPEIDEARRAMILYTSGTTGTPKGVVSTHRSIRAQIECLIEAWGWSARDRIVQFLPLHHVHGIVNILGCALWAGATCEMLRRFDAHAVWQRIASRELTLLMAVPTVYAKLIATWEAADVPTQRAWSDGCRALRLMVSGSAALPVSVLQRWREISGHTLLERYGMTEIGMALGNPLHGERVAGTVGMPMPGMEVRLLDERGSAPAEGDPGELQVRGPAVFREYWRRPADTAAAFDGTWFKTGDVAAQRGDRYCILGRASTDIIKTGGFKVSALEIEEVLRTHAAIEDSAVVALPDPVWGEVVAAAVVLRAPHELSLAELRAWAGERLASYKLPARLTCLDALPRNALGKVVKPEVAARLRAAD